MPIKGEYAVRESVTNMRRNLFVTTAAVLVVAVSLFLFGGVFLLRNAITRSANLWTQQVEVAVFLTADISEEQREQLRSDLVAMPEVRQVTYESKEQAYENFKKLFADQPDIIANTSQEVLPESLRVKLKDPEKFEVIRARLDGRPGVDSIRDEKETLRDVFNVASTLRAVALGMALVVGVAAMVLIATTIRMAIYARRKEIGIMKLVGATNWFIRVPFMLEGVVQGLIGSAVAVLLLVATRPLLAGILSDQFQNLGFQITYADVLVYGAYLLLAGVAVGAVGSMFGLRRFLDV